MSTLYESSSSDLESQFGSPYGYHPNIFAGHLRDEKAHRSRSSTSPFFSSKFDMSPANVPINHEFSADSLSDSEIIASDWNSFPYSNALANLDVTAPMSNHAFEDTNSNWHSVNSFSETSQTMAIPVTQPHQMTGSFDFSFAPHQFSNPQQSLSSKAATSPKRIDEI